jgi:sarcosine oxidase
MGSAAVWRLAKRGRRVLGLDRLHPPHTQGSSHGRSRIIREAYYEHPLYVPLVRRAYDLWADLESESGRRLLRPTGGLMIGPPEGVLVSGARRSAVTHGLPFDELSASEMRSTFPAIAPEDPVVGILEPRAGVLLPERCVEAALDSARRRGAELHFDEAVVGWSPEEGGVVVRSENGTYSASRCILATGAWLAPMARATLPLTVERQTAFWFRPLAHPERFSPESLPVYIWEWEPDRFFYGFPDLGDGIKIARHHEGESVQPDSVRREVGSEEEEGIRGLMRRFLPDGNGRLLDASVCLYTNTPDRHFLVDRHPESSSVLLASPCSGHGFKFAPAIGEVLARLACDEDPEFDLSPFRAGRLM